MEKDEIAAMYREAAYKTKEVGILAELNDCSPLLIKEVINEYYPGTFDLGIKKTEGNTQIALNPIDEVINPKKTQSLRLARVPQKVKKATTKSKGNAEKPPYKKRREKAVEVKKEIKAAVKVEETQQLQLASNFSNEKCESDDKAEEKVEEIQYLHLAKSLLPTIRNALTEKLAKLKEEEYEVLDAIKELGEKG